MIPKPRTPPPTNTYIHVKIHIYIYIYIHIPIVAYCTVIYKDGINVGGSRRLTSGEGLSIQRSCNEDHSATQGPKEDSGPHITSMASTSPTPGP